MAGPSRSPGLTPRGYDASSQVRDAQVRRLPTGVQDAILPHGGEFGGSRRDRSRGSRLQKADFEGFTMMVWIGLAVAGMLCAQAPPDVKPGSITYEEIAYPYPVQYLPLTLYGQDVRMAYMDVPAAGTPNGRTVMLFHGMNFGGFYFAGLIDVLRNQGFRVVVPDQIGFGRSSKPIIPYNFNDMALNSRKLLQSLGVSKVTIVGHSMGGMLSARFAASFPDITERAVIYNPIGLKDPRYDRPWSSADDAYKRTMAQTNDQRWQAFYANIRRYFPSPGAWKPEYEQYVRILYAPTHLATGLVSRWSGLFISRFCISIRSIMIGRKSRCGRL